MTDLEVAAAAVIMIRSRATSIERMMNVQLRNCDTFFFMLICLLNFQRTMTKWCRIRPNLTWSLSVCATTRSLFICNWIDLWEINMWNYLEDFCSNWVINLYNVWLDILQISRSRWCQKEKVFCIKKSKRFLIKFKIWDGNQSGMDSIFLNELVLNKIMRNMVSLNRRRRHEREELQKNRRRMLAQIDFA